MDNSTLAIKHHEQGKKHRENAEKNQRKMREARAAKQREEKALQDQLAAIESEAAKLSAADRVGGALTFISRKCTSYYIVLIPSLALLKHGSLPRLFALNGQPGYFITT